MTWRPGSVPPFARHLDIAKTRAEPAELDLALEAPTMAGASELGKPAGLPWVAAPASRRLTG